MGIRTLESIYYRFFRKGCLSGLYLLNYEPSESLESSGNPRVSEGSLGISSFDSSGCGTRLELYRSLWLVF